MEYLELIIDGFSHYIDPKTLKEVDLSPFSTPWTVGTGADYFYDGGTWT